MAMTTVTRAERFEAQTPVNSKDRRQWLEGNGGRLSQGEALSAQLR